VKLYQALSHAAYTVGLITHEDVAVFEQRLLDNPPQLIAKDLHKELTSKQTKLLEEALREESGEIRAWFMGVGTWMQ
jgi:hypothetical protein